MTLLHDIEYIPIAALQHFAFCPRQCAYIHIEREWDSNFLTATGDQLHERVHSDTTESRGGVRSERGVHVCSDVLGIQGKLDLLEIQKIPLKFTPIEYKRGRSKTNDCDRVQLCAQALCIEEMRNVRILKAALWYWQTRKRVWVDLDESLRTMTLGVIENTRALLDSGLLPKAVFKAGCKACSFYDRCQPQLRDTSVQYLSAVFGSHEETS